MFAANSILSRAAVISALFATSLVTPVFAQEAQTEVDLGKYRIDIAGRQRMLSQRIAKEICYIELGYHVAEHHEMLETDYHLFENTLIELRDGGGQYDIEPENDRRTLVQLERVFEHWAPFKAAIEEILATDQVTVDAEEHIIEYNLIMLNDMNETVTLIEQEYANPHSLEMSDALTLNLIARQRMLSQKAAKEFCYVATEHHVKEERHELAETRELFTATLNAVINGLPALGISPPPTDEIAEQLTFVSEIWQPMDEIFVNVAGGATPAEPEVAFIAAENLHLLAEMNNAVQLYVNH